MEQRLIQETDDAGNDGRIGQVEDVPVEAPPAAGDVEQHEIGHRPEDQPVDRVAQRPDDEPERHGGQSRVGAGQPDREQDDRTQLDADQDPPASSLSCWNMP